MSIIEVNRNREENGLKRITGRKNIMVIQTLLPQATFLATYKQFKKLGYQVKKGEKGFTLKGANHFKDKKGEEITKYYKFTVFDISQTQPIEV